MISRCTLLGLVLVILALHQAYGTACPSSYTNCATCTWSGGNLVCATCKAGYYTKFSTYCLSCNKAHCTACYSQADVCSVCATGFHVLNGECQCDKTNCYYCNNAGACASCFTGFHISSGSCVADVTCPATAAYTNCAVCATNSGPCTSCVTNYILNPNNNLCYYCTISNCNYCSASNYCGQCATNYVPDGSGGCISAAACPGVSFPNCNTC
jgi:hypothetical protein